ncbi:homoserine kinase [Bdellovibrionota bacterium FG-2]
MESVTAFAPASVGNAAVGFDVLGFAFPVVGDSATVSLHSEPKVIIEAIEGISSDLLARIPKDPKLNTAGVALLKMIEARDLGTGFRLSLKKGIALGSGMGGSAASAVAAVVAANALLDRPFSQSELLEFAVAGESVASGSKHADNVAPCLLGGLTAALSSSPIDVVQIPVPSQILCVLVHPHIVVETKVARAILKPEVMLSSMVRQSACLAGFISGCFLSDLGLIRRSMMDLIVEPQRAQLIPGFDAAKSAALENGALSFSISGAGPSVFAWVDSPLVGEKVRAAVVNAFLEAGLKADEIDSWIAPAGGVGARVVGDNQ